MAQDLGWGIHLLDTAHQRAEMAACYILVDNGEVGIIETGTKDTVPFILDFLLSQGLDTTAVKYVMPTHVHLDHAGGVGKLMQVLPHAQLVVHPQGARHMIDPSKLQAGATAVYGKEVFQKVYGDLIPVDPAQVIMIEDEQTLKLGVRTLTFLDTPGHARHHVCIHDDKSTGFFTGDTFGIAYQELTTEKGPFIFPTTTPVQFDPDAMKASIKRLMSYRPERMFLTHYGMIENLLPLADRLINMVDKYVEMALKIKQEHAEDTWFEYLEAGLYQLLLSDLANHGTDLTPIEYRGIIGTDVKLNAQGLEVWLAK
ncbi:MBL fold metallo-hydrolase [Oceaniserpentilla sp. 4NH20-0058]|uniref:MBL fold metallo-hydrolase n=1 Tax=Oceaniserpentilla sp. 4NH20-0058 TaxID=3127660 RepID=UPI00334087D6